MRNLVGKVAVGGLLIVIAVVAARAGGAAPVRRTGTAAGPPAEALTPATPRVFHGDVRRIPASRPGPLRERPEPKVPETPPPGGNVADAALQTTVPSAPAPSATSFAGLDYSGWGAGWPPDPNGDAGPSYYVQTVNTSVAMFDKSNGNRVAAFTFDDLFAQSPTGTPCDNNNQGDPVVVYDTIGGRWIVSDFAWSNYTSGAMYECMAVSRNSDPVAGGWYFYAWQIETGGTLPDYPKLGVWPDGIYMSANVFATTGAGSFKNAQVWVFNRQEMEAGVTAHAVSFNLPSKISGIYLFSLLPSNARVQTGLPPSGTPNLFASIYGIYAVRVWKFHVDWANTANSTLTGPTDKTISTFNVGPSYAPEKDGNALDTLTYRLMMQNQYANLNGTESLWLTHTVGDGGTPNVAQVRWYQLPVTGGTIGAPLQQSTWGPDSKNRFMPSLALDRNGDMAIGYSVSDSSMYPAIRYAGRLVGDPANTLGQSETSLFEGTGYQCCNFSDGTTNDRWGDYSAMTIDPDGCTFWYTNEYYANKPSTLAQDNWQTRIGSFKFGSCSPSSPAAPAVSGFTPTSGAVGTSVTINGSNLAAATNVSFHGAPSTSFAVVSPAQIVATVPAGATTGTVAVTTGGGTATSSGSFTVTGGGGSTTLGATPSSVAAGGTATVSWSNVAAPTDKDWIGLFHPGDANTAYIDWLWDDSCTKTAGSTSLASGSCSFAMPKTSGTYEFRLFANDGFTLLATSGTVTVTGGATLTATPSNVSAGGTVNVSWSSVPGATSRDWIGLFHPGDANTTYIDWLYDDSCTKTGGNPSVSAGSCSFPMPLTAGTYEFRLFSNDSYTVLATSGTVTVNGGATLGASPSSVSGGGTVTVSWNSVPSPTSHDWIGLFHPGDANTAYIDWLWDDSCTKTAGGTSLASGTCSFTMPLAAGTYEFRLFTNDSYTVLAKSGTVTVG